MDRMMGFRFACDTHRNILVGKKPRVFVGIFLDRSRLVGTFAPRMESRNFLQAAEKTNAPSASR